MNNVGIINTAPATPYQVRVDTDSVTGDWRDAQLFARTLEDIAASVGASPVDEVSCARAELWQLTELITAFIGTPNRRGGGSWDEIDMDVHSLQYDVLKISYTFGGVDADTRLEGRWAAPVKRRGLLTIMPGN